MISLKKSFIYKDLCYLMILWSVKLPMYLILMKQSHITMYKTQLLVLITQQVQDLVKQAQEIHLLELH